MKKLIDKIYPTRLFSCLFPTTIFCLRKNLRGCETVLDLGCGPSSPLQYCKNIKHSVGIEIFRPYLEETKRKKIHTEYLEKKAEEVEFPDKSFDAVILIEVLEHLPEKTGYAMLEKAGRWARKKVIISTPNGFLPQNEYDQNILQRHLSGWSLETLRQLGFQCQGLAGLGCLHYNKPVNVSYSQDDLTASIRFRPKFFWFAMATLSQFFTYYFPAHAFEIFCIKKIK